MTLAHGELTLLQGVIVLVCFGFTGLAAANMDDLEGLLVEAVVNALTAANIGIKAAAYYMGGKHEPNGMDEKLLRRQLNREPHQHLALLRLFRLPVSFWFAFTPVLLMLVARKRIAEIKEDFPSRERV